MMDGRKITIAALALAMSLCPLSPMLSESPLTATVCAAAKSTVTASVKGSTVTLKWDKVDGAAKYRVYEYKDGKLTKLGTVSKTSRKLKSVKSGTHYYGVSACVNGKWTSVKKADMVKVSVGKSAAALPFDGTLEVEFNVCANGYENIRLNADGTFSGQDYTNTTRSEYSGQFTDISKASNYSYSMTLKSLKYSNEPGTTDPNIIEGVDIEYTRSRCLEGSKKYVLYCPNTPKADLPEDVLFYYRQHPEYYDQEVGATLGCYALFAVDSGDVFFSGPAK